MECRGRNRPTMRVFTPSARCWEPFGGRRVLSAPENAKLRAKIMLMNRLIFIGLRFLVLLWRSEVLVGNSRISPLGRLNSRLGRCKFPVRAATGICWQGLDRPYFLRTNRSSAGGSGENSTGKTGNPRASPGIASAHRNHHHHLPHRCERSAAISGLQTGYLACRFLDMAAKFVAHCREQLVGKLRLAARCEAVV